jgi:hypothetical protein
MPTLVSPGVSVSVIDESFYASSGPGTVPLIFFATRSNKPTPGDSTSIAPGSLQENAGKLFLITSQRELIQTFGEPTFEVSEGTPIHGSELNEWGLFAAYSYLGIANRAFVVRADIDLDGMQPTAFEPTNSPINGTYWLDLGNSIFGVFASTGNNNVVPYNDWKAKSVKLIDVISEAETAMLGATFFADASSALSLSGSLIITQDDRPSSTTITVGTGNSLTDIVNAINTAANTVGSNIESIEASVQTYAKGVRIKLRHKKAGNLSISGTIVTALFGVIPTSVSIADARPNTNVSSTSNFAIVTLNNLNKIFERRTPVDADGNTLSGAVIDWHVVGSEPWRETVPTLVVGSNVAPVFSGTDQLVIELSLSNNTVVGPITISNSGSWTTIADVVADIVADGLIAPLVASGQVDVSVDLVGNLRFENRDGGNIKLYGNATDPLVLNIKTWDDTLLKFTKNYAKRRELFYSTHTMIPAGSRQDDIFIKTTQPNSGAFYAVKVYNSDIGQWVSINAPLFADDATANLPSNYGLTPTAGVLYVEYDVLNNGTALHRIKRWDGVAWQPLVYQASTGAPTSEAAEGTLWYNTQFDVDIMVSTGSEWVGLNNHPWYQNTDIILSASKPTTKPDTVPNGPGDLVENDIWIDTSDLENYPKMYRWRMSTFTWELIDNTDQTTPFGIVFADGRWATESGSQDAADLVVSDFVDPDAPNPLTYPNGMLLFNTRLSTFNVKEWKPNHFEDYTENALIAAEVDPPHYEVGTATFSPLANDAIGRWVTISGNQIDGSPWMGRKAQRQLIVRALQSVVVSNEDIRAENVFFNLLAAPGYVELVDELVTLNTDKKEWAFIVGDTPLRLEPIGTAIQNWATNTAEAATNGETGLLTANTYVGLYYPWALTTNLDGYEIVVPPSTVALRTMALNDNIAYQWFAPAGYQRGTVTNATSVGYLTSEDEFKPVFLNQGQRDVIYVNKINPIAFMIGQGLVVYGQKTRHPLTSALDRINVVRLINYLRYQFDILAKPYLFEPNDKQTRDAVKVTFERFLGNLISLRALLDFAVVCDESNNTPERIDRNELWIDVAIKPLRAIEFIYIPIRVLNTSDELPS